FEGGPHLAGTVFEMQKIKGKWTETPIYFFQGLPFGKSSDGTNPSSSVVFDQAGNLYGTTDYGGAAGVGAVYELSPNGQGGWTESVLYEFTDGADGGHPGPLIVDEAGNLYGATSGHNTFGSVYELSPPTGGGAWTFTVLYDFTGGADGGGGGGALLRDSSGNLYGTTTYGGAHNLGVVYEVTP
ncbi:MAG: choice-of-anchor tandem repeat GloVer-containing protein, partial [Terriglobales bacterium]